MMLEIIRRLPDRPTGRPPILCIHGAYHGAWCWDEHFLPYFAERGYEAIALSLRGHGDSAGRDRIAQWKLRDYLDDVLHVAATLPEPPIVMGHSLGGALALLFLEQHEAAAAVLLAPAAVGYMRRDALRWLVRHPWASMTSFLTRDMRRLLPTFRPHFFSPQTPTAVVEHYLGKMQEESYHVLTDQARLKLPSLRRSDTPILLVHATYDSIPRRQHEAIARHYGATLVTTPLGHEIMLEPEWRTVADAISEWLSEKFPV